MLMEMGVEIETVPRCCAGPYNTFWEHRRHHNGHVRIEQSKLRAYIYAPR
jgi:hypothetical protein